VHSEPSCRAFCSRSFRSADSAAAGSVKLARHRLVPRVKAWDVGRCMPLPVAFLLVAALSQALCQPETPDKILYFQLVINCHRIPLPCKLPDGFKWALQLARRFPD